MQALSAKDSRLEDLAMRRVYLWGSDINDPVNHQYQLRNLHTHCSIPIFKYTTLHNPSLMAIKQVGAANYVLTPFRTFYTAKDYINTNTNPQINGTLVGVHWR